MESLKSKIFRSIISVIKFMAFSVALVTGIFMIWFFDLFQPADNMSCDNYFETTTFAKGIEEELIAISKAALEIKQNEDVDFDMTKTVVSITDYDSEKEENYTYKEIEELCFKEDLQASDLERWIDRIKLNSTSYIKLDKEKYTELIINASTKNYNEKTGEFLNENYAKDAYIYIFKDEDKSTVETNKDNINTKEIQNNSKNNTEGKDVKVTQKPDVENTQESIVKPLENVELKEGDNFLVYSPNDDIFYSSKDGWFRLPKVLYFEKENLTNKDNNTYTIDDMLKYEYYSLSQVLSSCALNYMVYKEAKEYLSKDTSISYYIVEKNDNFECSNVKSIKEINELPFYISFSLSDISFKTKYQTEATKKQYKTLARFYQSYWGNNANLYFGLEKDYSDLSNLYEKSAWFYRYGKYIKKAMVICIVSFLVWFILMAYLIITAGDMTKCSRTITSRFDQIYSDIVTLFVIVLPIGLWLLSRYLQTKYGSLHISKPLLIMVVSYAVGYTITSLSFFSVIRRTKSDCYLRETILAQIIRLIIDFIKGIKKAGSKVIIYMVAVLVYAILNTVLIGVAINYKYEKEYENAIPVSVLYEYEDTEGTQLYEDYIQDTDTQRQVWYEYEDAHILILLWVLLNVIAIYYVGRKRIELVTIYDTAKTMIDGENTELINSNKMLLNERKLANSINTLYTIFKDKRDKANGSVESIDKAKTNIDEVIDLLKGSKRARKQVINVEQLLKDILNEYEQVIKLNGIKLETDFEQDESVIVSDKIFVTKLITDVIACVCNNAQDNSKITVSIYKKEKKIDININCKLKQHETNKLLELSIAKIYVLALKGIMIIDNDDGKYNISIKFNEITKRKTKG